MKKFLGLICLIFVGTVGWRIGNQLSSDAISMALGVFFGVLAGIPAALLVLASDRNRPSTRATHAYGMTQHASAPQPPVIVLNGGGMLPTGPSQQHHAGYGYNHVFNPHMDQPQYLYQQQGFALAGAGEGAGDGRRPARRFKVVGEQEEWIEEW